MAQKLISLNLLGVLNKGTFSLLIFFIFAMEYLFTMITSLVSSRNWKPFKLRNHDLKISHPFANNVFLLAKVDPEMVDIIYHTIDIFCKTIGMQINLDKSKLWLSLHIRDHRKTSISNALRISITINLGTYLGFPLKPKYSSNVFDFVVHRIRQKLQGWKMQNLSFAGRSQLNAATLHQISCYQMRIFACLKKFIIKLIKSIEIFYGVTQNQQTKPISSVGIK